MVNTCKPSNEKLKLEDCWVWGQPVLQLIPRQPGLQCETLSQKHTYIGRRGMEKGVCVCIELYHLWVWLLPQKSCLALCLVDLGDGFCPPPSDWMTKMLGSQSRDYFLPLSIGDLKLEVFPQRPTLLIQPVSIFCCLFILPGILKIPILLLETL